MKIVIAGVAGTNGYTLTFSKNNTHAHLLLWPSNMGNQGDAWKNAPDTTFISAIIESQRGEIVDQRILKGDAYFTLTPNTTYDFDIEIGTKIKIFTELPGNVGVWLVNTNERLSEYNNTAKNFTFLVTKNGIMPEYKSNFNMSDVLYEHQKDYFLQNMEEIKEYFDGKDNVLDAKYFSVDEKNKYIECYEKLQEEDRQEYTDLYNKILAGGKPKITVLKNNITVNQGESIDFYGCFSAYDMEDGNIEFNNSNFKVVTDKDLSVAGTYEVEIQISDSDGNVSTEKIKLNIISTRKTLSTGVIIGICLVAASVVGIAAAVTVVLNKKKKAKV